VWGGLRQAAAALTSLSGAVSSSSSPTSVSPITPGAVARRGAKQSARLTRGGGANTLVLFCADPAGGHARHAPLSVSPQFNSPRHSSSTQGATLRVCPPTAADMSQLMSVISRVSTVVPIYDYGAAKEWAERLLYTQVILCVFGCLSWAFTGALQLSFGFALAALAGAHGVVSRRNDSCAVRTSPHDLASEWLRTRGLGIVSLINAWGFIMNCRLTCPPKRTESCLSDPHAWWPSRLAASSCSR
jgi:hypothetical protein